MNRKQLLSIALILCVLAGMAPSYGQTSVTLGMHYWYSMLEVAGAEEMGLSIDPGNMFGPYLNLRIGKIILGSSLFFGTYTFNWEDFGYEYSDGSDWYFFDFSNNSTSAKRQDMNFSVGFNLARYFNIFGAYKQQKLTYSDEFNYDAYIWNGSDYVYIESGSETIEEETSIGYIGGGASAIVPFGARSPLFLFGSAAYLIAQDKDDIDYLDVLAITAGIGFASRSGLSFMAGYRADMDMGGDEDTQGKIHGFMATVAYTIR
jgi:hypothetical protein